MSLNRHGFIYYYKRWFKHWLVFQCVAILYKCWKPKMLFHDWYKPFLHIFFCDKDVQSMHRKWSSHHPEGGGTDYVSMVIDFECSRYTKPEKPLNARMTLYKYYPELIDIVLPIIIRLGL